MLSDSLSLEPVIGTPTLETARLILRPVTVDDAPDIQRLFGVHKVIRFIGPVPWPYPADGAYDFLQNKQLPAMALGKTLGWAITQKDTGTFMGALDVRPDADDTIGFWLGTAFHNQGYMSETVCAAYDYAFDIICLSRIGISNAAANIPSHTIQIKSGAHLVSINESIYDGAVQPQETWEITPPAWRASPMKRNAPEPSYVIR